MRNFRTAAVATATALTVVAGGTAIASAADQAEEQNTGKDRQVIFAGKQNGNCLLYTSPSPRDRG